MIYPSNITNISGSIQITVIMVILQYEIKICRAEGKIISFRLRQTSNMCDV